MKNQILTGWKMKTFRAYSNIVFAGWDFALTSEEAGVARHYNLTYEIQVKRRANVTLSIVFSVNGKTLINFKKMRV